MFEPDFVSRQQVWQVKDGLFKKLKDLLARTVTAGEIPLGIITSLIGSVIFVLLMVSPLVRLKQ